MIYSIAIFTIVLAADLITDFKRWLENKKINHIRGLILRVAGLLPSVYLLPHDKAIGAAMEGIWYLILFNGLFGLLTQRNWFYLGDSWLDNQQKKLGLTAFALQYGMLIFTSIVFLLK